MTHRAFFQFIIADGSKLSEYTVEGTTFAPDGDILYVCFAKKVCAPN